MTIIIGVVLVLMAAGVIAHPFWRVAQGRASKGHWVGRDEENMTWMVGEAMARELESDYRSGIMTKNEYEEMESEHTIALPIDIAKETVSANIDEQVEARVSQVREIRRRVATANKPLPVKKADGAVVLGGGSHLCSKCGEAYREGDLYCGHCGVKLPSRGSAT